MSGSFELVADFAHGRFYEKGFICAYRGAAAHPFKGAQAYFKLYFVPL